MNAVLSPPPIWTTTTTEGNRTGTWRASRPWHIVAPSPCHQACPVHGDIASWIGQAREGDARGAWLTLVAHNPFPAITGRICHHPCEAACNRVGVDGALSICKLERWVGDQALAQGWSLPAAAADSGRRVAVVGAGPSGLSAAWQLRRRGHAVTLFESRPQAGGLMRDGIPAYRLSRRVLDAEVDRLLATGIDPRFAAPAPALAELQKDFDAVYLATGAARPKRLPQLDAASPQVVDGATWLLQANAGAPPAVGPRVLVIGGGSAAFDAARSARRHGHAVTLMALEDETWLPAQPDEVDEAREEGVVVIGGARLTTVTALEGGRLRIGAERVQAERGRIPPRVTPVEGSAFTLEVDAIVPSIGADPDLGWLSGVACTGPVLTIDADGATSRPGVWAGGDLASMARHVSTAIGMGEAAVLAMHRALGGAMDAPRSSLPALEAAVPLSAISLFHHPAAARATGRRVDVDARLAHHDEVQLALTDAEALAETQRCFSCGTCTHCNHCVIYCPDLAVQPDGDSYRVLTDYCKGCGVCVAECPSGSMTMQEEVR